MSVGQDPCSHSAFCLQTRSILETHSKTHPVIISFLIEVSGWWAWNAFLASAYSANLSPYDVKGGFTKTIGRDPDWWLLLILTLAILITIELALKSARRTLALGGRWPLWKRQQNYGTKNAQELELEVWQEMEQDGGIRERLRAQAANGCNERTE